MKFSAKGESPDVKRSIRLATPSNFRESGYEPRPARDTWHPPGVHGEL